MRGAAAVAATVIGLVLAWGGIWLLAAAGLQRAALDWFAAQSASGRSASFGSLGVTGFPGRLALTLNAVSLVDPATGTGWQIARLHLASPSYQPWQISASLPGPLRILIPTETVTLGATGLQGDLTLTPLPSLPLGHFTLSGSEPRVRSSLGWQIEADHARLAIASDPTGTNSYTINLTVTDLAPDPALVAALAGPSELPPRLDLVEITAVATLTAPLDRHADQTHPTLASLDINESTLRWGPLILAVSGHLTPDATGRAEGRIGLRLDHWQQALIAARASGLIRADLAPALGRSLTLLALESGTPDRLDLALTLHGGLIRFGPIPLGHAPLLP